MRDGSDPSPAQFGPAQFGPAQPGAVRAGSARPVTARPITARPLALAAISLAMGALTSLAVPGACVALDVDTTPHARDIVCAQGSLYVVGRAEQPGIRWVSVCYEGPLVNPLARDDNGAYRAAELVGWPIGEEVTGMLSVGWPWPVIDMAWIRTGRADFPGDPRDNTVESGNLADAIRRAVSGTPSPTMSLSVTNALANAIALGAPWWIALRLAARGSRSSPARAAPRSARP